MIDRAVLGQTYGPYTASVETQPLRLFAKATGQTDPVFFDADVAQAAGYRSILAPPTYVMCLIDLHQDNWPTYGLLALDQPPPLHGSQSFDLFAPICAGDSLTLTHRIADIYDRKGGALEFVVIETELRGDGGVLVARATSTEVFVTKANAHEC